MPCSARTTRGLREVGQPCSPRCLPWGCVPHSCAVFLRHTSWLLPPLLGGKRVGWQSRQLV